VILGVVFLCILLVLGGLFLFLTSPDSSPTAALQETITAVTGGEAPAGEAIDSNPMLNESQETALKTVGIDPASLPTTISPEQEACFEVAIGADRVEEIKAGGTPTAIEIFRGRGCL
jgi:hypothetical protein